MSTYDQILNRGRREGVVENKIEVILNGWRDGLPVAQLARLLSITEAEVEEIVNEHKDAKTESN